MPDPADPQPELVAQSSYRNTASFDRLRGAAECNRLPANCPFTKRLPKQRPHIAAAIENGTISCCRIEWPSWLEGCKGEPPLCCIDGDEVYRFLYTHAFGQHAVIRIGKRRDEITAERSYYEGMFSEPERFSALLAEVDWERVQAAIAAADFWSLPRSVDP
jgi:hypothetical protein